ncbi:hypothetical protein [Dactylosporangium siamense]|uniref:hypothetical protein n=1 Tax=Dactylosporangium siamense TaxID=685454 RepID=UPI0019425861|nr:hypothetical protein [Dactylosporangium siamense]
MAHAPLGQSPIAAVPSAGSPAAGSPAAGSPAAGSSAAGSPAGKSTGSPRSGLPGTPTAAVTETTKPVKKPVPSTFAQACTPAALLAFVRSQSGGPPGGFTKVEVYNCVDTFARLYAGDEHDNGDQFFLQFVENRWQVLAHGLSIDCGDAKPQLIEACSAFE